MTREERNIYGNTVKILAVIKAAYPEFNRDVDHAVAIRIWHSALIEYTYEACDEAVAKHIRTSRFAPKISDIIAIVKELDDPYGFKKYPVDEWQCSSWINFSTIFNIPLKQWQVELISRYPNLQRRLRELPPPLLQLPPLELEVAT